MAVAAVRGRTGESGSGFGATGGVGVGFRGLQCRLNRRDGSQSTLAAILPLTIRKNEVASQSRGSECGQ